MCGGRSPDDSGWTRLRAVISNWPNYVASFQTAVHAAACNSLRALQVKYGLTRANAVAVLPISLSLRSVLTRSDAASSTDLQAQFEYDMDNAVEDALYEAEGAYAVVIKDLKTNRQYVRNEGFVFATASLYKLWVMAEAYRQIADGIFSEEMRMSGTEKSLNHVLEMKMNEALERMIVFSDNHAAYLLLHNIGRENLKQFVNRNGFTKSQFGLRPKSTAWDMFMFLHKLYNNELGSPKYTQKMLNLLAHQTRNDVIPKYLPGHVTVMHKTGELGRIKHDVGIVSTANRDYIIVLMSASPNRKFAAERMASLSKKVYGILS